MPEGALVTRVAPSPTGWLHIGTVYQALLNKTLAEQSGGVFYLRIEDTDAERTSQEYVDNIFDSLKALGLNWDEGPDVGGPYGPYQQSERFDIYPKYIQELLDKGFAYECFCTPEELEAEKEEATANKKAYVYSKKCENLTEEEKAKLRAEGRKPAIRFNIAKAQKAFHDSSILKFDDLVKGELQMDTNLIGDFVIMKSNGAPTYNYAVVIDDALMKISHVIRGEDHISNTYKQILIFEALGFDVPRFGHLGMILAPDRSKLSKRHGATAVSDFVEQGYLTEALVNFVALLGWAPSDGEEVKPVEKIAEDFRIGEVSSSNSIFEYDKLKWMNSHYIKALPIETLKEMLKKYLKYIIAFAVVAAILISIPLLYMASHILPLLSVKVAETSFKVPNGEEVMSLVLMFTRTLPLFEQQRSVLSFMASMCLRSKSSAMVQKCLSCLFE